MAKMFIPVVNIPEMTANNPNNIIIIILLVMMGRMPNIGYYAFEKLFDKTNMSVAWRYIPYYVNWGCFKSSFLIGIGNGNQGFLL